MVGIRPNAGKFSENGLTTHCSQIEACGVFLVNGEILAQINLENLVNFKSVKPMMPLFKNTKPVDHRYFKTHSFGF